MIRRTAAPGLPRRDQHLHTHTAAADELPGQGHRNPRAAPPATGPVAPDRKTRVHRHRPRATRGPAPPPPDGQATPTPAPGTPPHDHALAPRPAQTAPRRDLRTEAARPPAHRPIDPRPAPPPGPREQLLGVPAHPRRSRPWASRSPPPPSGKSSKSTASRLPPNARARPGPTSCATRRTRCSPATSSKPAP